MKKIFSIALVALVVCCIKVSAQSTGAGLTIKKRLTDDQLLTLVQKQTFRYFWDGAEPVSGLARERYHSDNIYEQQDKDIIATGASGFGFGAIIVGRWLLALIVYGKVLNGTGTATAIKTCCTGTGHQM
jgi:hypothetical protein